MIGKLIRRFESCPLRLKAIYEGSHKWLFGFISMLSIPVLADILAANRHIGKTHGKRSDGKDRRHLSPDRKSDMIGLDCFILPSLVI
jgi:hypothetical protein